MQPVCFKDHTASLTVVTLSCRKGLTPLSTRVPEQDQGKGSFQPGFSTLAQLRIVSLFGVFESHRCRTQICLSCASQVLGLALFGASGTNRSELALCQIWLMLPARTFMALDQLTTKVHTDVQSIICSFSVELYDSENIIKRTSSRIGFHIREQTPVVGT